MGFFKSDKKQTDEKGEKKTAKMSFVGFFKMIGGFFYRLVYIFGIVWKTSPWIMIIMSLIALLQGVLPIIGSLISRSIINCLQSDFGSIEPGDIAGFLSSAVFMILVIRLLYRVFNKIVERVNNAVTKIAGEKVTRTVKLQIMNKSKHLDIASFDSPAFYEKLENANREAGTRPITVLSSTFTTISHIISIISYIMILATVPGMWWIPIIMICVSAPSAIVSFVYRRKHYNYLRYRSKERRQMNYYANMMAGREKAKEIRLFDLSDLFIERYDNVFARYYSGLRHLLMRENVLLVVLSAFATAVSSFFFMIFAYSVMIGQFLLGDYTLYTNALLSISNNVSVLINSSANIYEGTLFIDNLIDFMKEKQTVVTKKKNPDKVSHGTSHTIVFDHVSFAYPGSDKKVISDINLTIRPGETLVLVGLNGAGKTTLIKLLTRLYDPTEGRILLDGKDIRNYDVNDLYRLFGIIFQDFGKYAETVKENIRYGNIHKECSDEEIKKAAVSAAADQYIRDLAEGYDTPLMRIFEENGTELSGGQWQKLAVSRAFYSDSDILILDEPTAALDPIAEQEIFKQFDNLRKDKTTVFVSHRLSSAVIASKILVLEQGRVIEEGTHSELMKKKGRYYELFEIQAERYIEEDEKFNIKKNRK